MKGSILKGLFISVFIAFAMGFIVPVIATADTTATSSTSTTIKVITSYTKTDPKGNIIAGSPTTTTSTTENKKPQGQSTANSSSGSNRTSGDTAPVKTKKHTASIATSTTTSTDSHISQASQAPVKKPESVRLSTSTTLEEAVVVKGEKIKNPALATQAKKLKVNKASIDFKPFLAMAILLIIAGRTSFERTSFASSRRRENKINNRMGSL